MTQIEYRDGDTTLRGELVGAPGPAPGVVVVHGGAGLDEHARRQSARIAALGYVVLAADLYGSDVDGPPDGRRERVMTTIGALRADPDRLVRRAMAAVDVLAGRAEVTRPAAAVGYCFGGMTVLELARSGADLPGVVSIHGSLTTGRPAREGAVRARVLASHGAADPHVPWSQVTAFVEEMDAARADWELDVHGGAQHGFTHDPDAPPTPGVAFHADADARTFATLSRFLGELRA